MKQYNYLLYNDDFTVCNGFVEEKDKEPKFHPNTKVINVRAFENTNIEIINLKDTNLEYIENWAFAQCKNLKTIIFPDTLREICGGAFIGCKNLKTVDLSNTKIDALRREVFSECGIEKINLPQKLVAIKEYVFAGCKNLYKLDLPENFKYLDISCVEDTNISKLELPENINNINIEYARYVTIDLSNLKEIVYTKLSDENIQKLEQLSKAFKIKVNKADLDYLIKKGVSFKQIVDTYKDLEK